MERTTTDSKEQQFHSREKSSIDSTVNNSVPPPPFQLKAAQPEVHSTNTIQKQDSEKDNSDLEKIIEKISFGVLDWVVTGDEQSEVVQILKSTSDVDSIIEGLESQDMLDPLIYRISSYPFRKELLQILGRGANSSNFEKINAIVKGLGLQWELQLNMGRLGADEKGAAFDSSTYQDLIAENDSEPFTGSGATGTNPSELSPISSVDQVAMVFGHDTTRSEYSNPLTNRYEEVFNMDAGDRERQAALLLGQPISSFYENSYSDELPSRLQVVKAAAEQNKLEPEVVAAFLLTEQRDQSANEDRADYQAATSVLSKNTSIGLGQVVVSTAQNNDLFSDLLSEESRERVNGSHHLTAQLLASDEFNIFAVAKYIRQVADQGAALVGPGGSPPNLLWTFLEYPNIEFDKFGKHSMNWPMDNLKALASEYTSSPWDDQLVPL